MKKITLISLSTPTFNNVRAASALPYHLIKGAKESAETEFEIYSFNINNIDAMGIGKTEQELGVKIRVLKQPKFIRWLFRFHLLFLRVFLKFPLYTYLSLCKETQEAISRYNPDIVWIYGEEIAGLAKLFSDKRCIVTMPDCESMYYYRLLSKRSATDSLLKTVKYLYAYLQYRRMEKSVYSDGVLYHFVGKADRDFFKEINPKANAIFLRHPLYAYNDEKIIKFHQPQIKLLFAGRYDFYCSHGSDDLLKEIIKSDTLKKQYEITFLGKGWENWNELLNNAGWTAKQIVFAPDYIEELQKHDIQVNAIDIGTGTKGKVLDAISNGLLEFGTQYALENITVVHNESCILYYDITEAIEILKEIPQNTTKYETMAMKGRQMVIDFHSRKVIALQLFK